MSPTRTSRRGFSLLEIVLVMGGVSILLGLCGGLIHLMLRLDRVGRSHVAETATIGRLAHRFRRDIHASNRARPGDDEGRVGSYLELVLPGDRRVEYRVRGHQLIRSQHPGELAARTETYTLPFCREPRFLAHDADQEVRVSLQLPRGEGLSPESLRHVLTIDAAVGRDHRFSRPTEASR